MSICYNVVPTVTEKANVTEDVTQVAPKSEMMTETVDDAQKAPGSIRNAPALQNSEDSSSEEEIDIVTRPRVEKGYDIDEDRYFVQYLYKDNQGKWETAKFLLAPEFSGKWSDHSEYDSDFPYSENHSDDTGPLCWTPDLLHSDSEDDETYEQFWLGDGMMEPADDPSWPKLSFDDLVRSGAYLAPADDVSLVTAFTVTTSDYDARKYPLGPPHDGSKGPKFEIFAQNFLSRIQAVELKDPNEMNTLDETLVGVDEGGDVAPAGAAAPIPIGGLASQKRRLKRLKMAYAYLYQHTDNDILRRMLVDEAYGDGRAAWQLLVRECHEDITDLELQDLQRDVRDLTISGAIGYTETSLSKFRQALSDANTKIPQATDRISEPELCCIMLNSIASSTTLLAAAADTELKAATGDRKYVYPAGHPRAGERSLGALVSHFEPLWKSAVQRGQISKRLPAKSRATAAAVTSECEQAGIDADLLDMRPGDVLALVASFIKDNPRTATDIICWNCKGIGHPKSKCPSAVRDRSYADAIKLLTVAAETHVAVRRRRHGQLGRRREITGGRNERRSSFCFRAAHA
jgi:hypothetical protein